MKISFVGTVFVSVLLFLSQSWSCMNLEGQYQCTRKIYFWEDKPRLMQTSLKVVQKGLQMEWQIGSSIGDWIINGVENTSYKSGSKNLHKVTCLNPKLALKAEEAFAVDTQFAVYRTVEIQRESNLEIFVKLNMKTAFGNQLLDESTERWLCKIKNLANASL